MSVSVTAQSEIDRTLLKHNMTNENMKDCTDEVLEDTTAKPSCYVKAVSFSVE